MSEFPFLFYGSKPRDWLEGKNLGHHYEIRFREPPPPETKEILGELWGLHTSKGAVVPGKWLWCGAWALVAVGERRGGQADAFFRKMAELFRALHQVAPIAEVVFWGSRADTDDPWEAWTRSRQPTPTPGPVYSGLAPVSWYGQTRDPALGTPAADSAFDHGRAQAPPPEQPEPDEETPELDASAPDDLDDAVERVETFLTAYTDRAEFFEDNEPLVVMQHTAANAGEDGIEVVFGAPDPDDPDAQALCEKAIAALQQANPNLGYEITWELTE